MESRPDRSLTARRPRGRRAGALAALGSVVVVSSLALSAGLPWAAPSRDHARAKPATTVSVPARRLSALKASPADSTRLYAATPDGLLASVDGGASWSVVPVAGSADEVLSLGLHPADAGIVIAGRRDGLWKTEDGGGRWAPLAAPAPVPFGPLAIALAPSAPERVYVATARHGVAKSVDGGQRWQDASGGLPPAPTGGRPAQIETLAVDPLRADTVYVAESRDGVFRTTDAGAGWTPFNDGLSPFALPSAYPPRLVFDPDAPARLYLVLGRRVHSRLLRNQLLVSRGGAAWLPVEVELPVNTVIQAVTVDRGARALTLWSADGVWQVALPAGADGDS